TLRLEVEDENLIFAPGETLRFSVEPAIVGLAPGASLDLALDLVEGRTGRSHFSESQRVTLPARGSLEVPWQITLPAEQGVYTVTVVARHPPANRVPFWGAGGRQEPLASRKFQVVVIDPRPLSRFANPQWTSVVEI